MHVFDFIVGALALLGLFALVGLLWELVERWLHRDRDAGDPMRGLDWDADEHGSAVELAHAYAGALEETSDWHWMTPEALEPDPRFQAAVERLVAEDVPVADVVDLARDPDGWVAAMALVALERRDDVPYDWPDWALRGVPRPSYCEDAFSCERWRGTPRHRRSGGSSRAPGPSALSTSSTLSDAGSTQARRSTSSRSADT